MSKIANPFVTRRYGVDGEPGREVTLTIGKPRPWRRDWACRILIEGLPKERRTRVHGVDSLQALQLALIQARRELDASGVPLTWLDGEPGDAGIPLPAPSGLGFGFQRELEQIFDRERTKLESGVTAFLKEEAAAPSMGTPRPRLASR